MKVLMLKSNEVVDYANKSYAARLIEQGRAVLAPAPEKKPEKSVKAKSKKE